MTLLAATAACGGSAAKVDGDDRNEPVVLTFASNNRGLPSQIAEFLDQVARRGDGDVQLDYIDGWREGESEQEAGLIADVRDGEVDIAWVGARGFDSVGVTSFQALVAPFLVDSYDLQDDVFAAGIPMRMLQGLDELGLTGIGVLPGPLRQIVGIDHAFVMPADFAGEIVGTSGGDLAELTFRALGATPTMVPAETSLDGLDGLDYHVAAIYGNRFYDGATHVTGNLDLWPRPLVIFANSDRFAGLTEKQQAILRDAAAASVAPASTATRVEEAESGNGLCSVGIEIVEIDEDERAALRHAVDAVYEELEADSITSGFLDEIRAVKQRTDAEPEALVCPAEASESAESSPIDGVWRVTTTAGELRAAGDPAPIPENFGEWVYVFSNGRFAFTQENDEACTWGYGTHIRRRRPPRMDIYRWRRDRAQRRGQQAGRILRVRVEPLPRHTDPERGPGRDLTHQFHGRAVATNRRPSIGGGVRYSLPATRRGDRSTRRLRS